MPPDFSRLYRELGLQPDCSLDAFRRAYRVLVSRQHPDRPAARSDGAGALALSELMVLHEQALQFHREHGRLPGAPLSPAAGQATLDGDARAATPTVERIATARAASMQVTPAARTSHRQAWLAVGVLVLIAIGVSQPQAPTPTARAAAATQAAAVDGGDDAPQQLAVGMDAATARSIQGEPLRIHDGEWEYGPSWLRFERDLLVDWYSSPLRPLKVPDRDARPAPATPR